MEKNKINRYPAYKPSGAEWLGEILEHWDTLVNKYIFKLKKNQVGKKSGDYVLLSLTLNGVIIRDMVNPQGKFPAEFDTYQEVKKGDFIFCLFDVEETPRTVGLSAYDGMITGAYTVMQHNDNFDGSFLYYFYLNLDADKRMKSLYTGLRNTISKENFFSFKTFVPALKEQTTIASFLDRKTAQIEQASALKYQMIELLKERRQILIQNAVTKGLNSEIKMKESGEKWIGDIPEHWELKRIKNIFMLIIDPAPINNNFELLSIYTDIGVKPRKDLEQKGNRASTTDGYWFVKKGDFIVNKLLAWMGAIGLSHYDGVTSPAYDILRPKIEISGQYYHSLFRTKKCSSELKKHSRGIMEMRLRLYFDKFGAIKFPYPPLREQIEIANYIEAITAKIDIAISLKEKEIEKLKEYKATLINSAVTGKIKVC